MKALVPTGQRDALVVLAAYHNRNVGIFTVRDGKITAVREYTDTQHAAHVLFGQPWRDA
jgi:limonene-1,2-epoxide hydrolase